MVYILFIIITLNRTNNSQFLFKAGFLMDDIQFKELCARMKVGKSLSYQDFLDHFQRQNNAEYSEKMQTSWVNTYYCLE